MAYIEITVLNKPTNIIINFQRVVHSRRGNRSLNVYIQNEVFKQYMLLKPHEGSIIKVYIKCLFVILTYIQCPGDYQVDH